MNMTTQPAPSALLTPVVVHEGWAFVSGQLPRENGELRYCGKVGQTVDLATAVQAARLSAMACLDALERELGSLEKIVRVLKITGFVSSADDFIQQGKVIDGASALLTERLGEAGKHARSAVGVAQLPHGASVEVEMIVAVRT
jgi:enamine deaminase RidA (YjgF/YER057c/UK114 family)